MRVFQARVGVALVLIAGAASAPAAAQGRLVTEIPYITCDGSLWRAGLDGDRFLHTARDADAGHQDTVIHYRTWGGSCWRATWDADARRFEHSPFGSGTAHPDTILNFLDWEGVPWTARRDGDDWIVTRKP